MAATFTIGTVAALTGLSPHTIRAWERRYGGLLPERTGTNRRVYSDHDVERLLLLKRIADSGHSIGQIAHLPSEQLHTLDSEHRRGGVPSQSQSGIREDSHLAACLEAIDRLDPEGLENGLVRGAAELGIHGMLTDILIPIISAVDLGWTDGSINISQEHMTSAVMRTYLDRLRLSMPVTPMAPRLILTTPRHQHHEIGALIVAIVAAMKDWNVIYLGPNLPADEIAEAARKTGAAAIGLSIVYPLDDVGLSEELALLRRKLGPSIPILVGGRAAHEYASTLESIGAHFFESFDDFRNYLAKLAAPR